MYVKDGFTLKDIKFDWFKNNPVTISNKLEMPDFVLTSHNASMCNRITATGEYIFFNKKKT